MLFLCCYFVSNAPYSPLPNKPKDRNSCGVVGVTALDYLTQFHLGGAVLSTVVSLFSQLQQCNSVARVMGRNPYTYTSPFGWDAPHPFFCYSERVSHRRHLGCATSLSFSQQEMCSTFQTGLLSWKPSVSLGLHIAAMTLFLAERF